MMAPDDPILAALSLYRLPLPTQKVLRGLLLLPLGALVVAIFRNGIGIPTYGTFMPVLIAYAIRDFSQHAHALACGEHDTQHQDGEESSEWLHRLTSPSRGGLRLSIRRVEGRSLAAVAGGGGVAKPLGSNWRIRGGVEGRTPSRDGCLLLCCLNPQR